MGWNAERATASALLERGVTPAKLADAIGVDPKTIERWIVQGRMPYRRHRYAVAAHLRRRRDLPVARRAGRDQVAAASESEILSVYPHRWAVPRDTWGRLFEQAEREIGILVYSGMFLADDAGIMAVPRQGAAGVRVRILLGDPDSPRSPNAGTAEGIDEAIAAKIRNVIVLVPAAAAPRAWRSGCTPRSCTTRSTAPTASCWSTRTSTASRPPTRR